MKILVIEREEKILHIENLNLDAAIKNKRYEGESLGEEEVNWQTLPGPT